MDSYIGVTGFMSRAEVEAVLSWFEGESRKAMIGVLASDKTVKGELNRHPNRFPKVGEIGGIFAQSPQALNLIHYNTHDGFDLQGELERLREVGGENLGGFQLNMVWPDPRELYRFRISNRELVLILQIGAEAMSLVGGDPETLARRIARYVDIVDGILIDPSGGVGREFDPTGAIALLDEIRREAPKLGRGVAGGLGPQNLRHLYPVAARFPDLSIDAEGKLRDENDRLELNYCRLYVEEALLLFTQAR